MNRSRIEEQCMVPKDVNYDWLLEKRQYLEAKLLGNINITKALYGDHSVTVLTRPIFELKEISDLGLFLAAMIMIDTIEEVPA